MTGNFVVDGGSDVCGTAALRDPIQAFDTFVNCHDFSSYG